MLVVGWEIGILYLIMHSIRTFENNIIVAEFEAKPSKYN